MTQERLKSIMEEYKNNRPAFDKDGGSYFIEFLPAIEGYYSYASAIAADAEKKERVAKIEISAKKAQAKKKR